jgi:hypothetical protein
MRNLPVTITLFGGLIAGCLAQTVRLAPGVSMAEADYNDAVDAWAHADPDLAKDLLHAPPETMRARIRHVAALRDDAMVKKHSYLTDLVERLQKAQKQITDSTAPALIPPEAIQGNLPEERARLESRQQGVETLLRQLPSDAEYDGVRRDLEDERDRLQTLHNDLAARRSALDAVGRAQDGVNFAATAGLAAKLQAVVQVWERERDDVERQRAHWKEVYAAMERAVDANAKIVPVAAGKAPAGKKKETSK